jgi:chloramphenicol-sensitive protein RarD
VTPALNPGSEVRRGALFGTAAYMLWGFFPLYFHGLSPATPLEVLAHRILWSLFFCLIILAWRRDVTWVRPLFARPRLLAGLTAAALLVAINWGVYVAAVLSGHTRDAALGYFLNPLITVALGVVLLREPLRRLQWMAVAIGLVAAVFLTVAGGQVPVIALTLAVTFALYGLLKKRIGASLGALHGLTIETAVLLPIALLLLGPLSGLGGTHAGFGSVGQAAGLILTGPITAIPLLLFAAAARRVPLVTIGLLQFLTPVMQLLCGLLLGEVVTPTQWVGFVIVWVALGVLTVDSLRQVARSR